MSNRDTVVSLYNNILFRDASEAEINGWVSVLDRGAPLDDVRSSFENSIEAINNVDPILRLYDGLLNRQGEKAGVDVNVDAFRATGSLEFIAQSFIDSPEFQAQHAGISRGDFITLLYNNVLERQPDQGGYDAYNNSNLSFAQIAKAFVESPEATALNDLGQERLLERFASGQDAEIGSDLNNTPTPPETVFVPVPGDTVFVPVPGDTVFVPVPGPTVIQEPAHEIVRSVDATLDFLSTRDFAGTEVNYGAGNFANNYSIALDKTSGVELGLKVHYRTGNDVMSSSVDANGVVTYTADSGFQNGANNANGVAQNRSAVSVDFSINAGVNAIDGANVEGRSNIYKLLIDTDKSAATNFLTFTVQEQSDGTNYMTAANGTPVIGDSDGTNVHIYQDSVNFGFGFINNNFVGGANTPSGNIQAGQYDVILQEFNKAGTTLYAENHIILNLVDPVALTAQPQPLALEFA